MNDHPYRRVAGWPSRILTEKGRVERPNRMCIGRDRVCEDHGTWKREVQPAPDSVVPKRTGSGGRVLECGSVRGFYLTAVTLASPVQPE